MTNQQYQKHIENFWTIRKTKKISHQVSDLYFALLDELSNAKSKSVTLTDEYLKEKTGIVWIDNYRQELVDAQLIEVNTIAASTFNYSII